MVVFSCEDGHIGSQALDDKDNAENSIAHNGGNTSYVIVGDLFTAAIENATILP